MSVGVVLVATLIESAAGPVPGQSLLPTARLWGYFRTTICMAALATTCAQIVAVPFAAVLANLPVGRFRRAMTALIVLPLLTMPSIHAYAWMLLATRKSGIAAAVLNALGWNAPGAQWMQAAVVLSAWLWPISALTLSAAFRQTGRQGFLLARLDADGLSAFIRGALPLMRGPVIAAIGVTFLLAAIDATIPPLMGAFEVWSVEMLAAAGTATSYSRPIAFLFWQSWPMLALITAILLAAVPGIRGMSRWGEEIETADTGDAIGNQGRFAILACVLAAGIAFFPLMVFATEFDSSRTGLASAAQTAFRTFRTHGLATLIAAIGAGFCALAAGLGVVDDPDDSRVARWLGKVSFLGVVAAAVLPPEIIGTSLAATFSRISDPGSWNIYDCTPWAWIAAILSRFAVISIVISRLMNKRVPESLLAQARLEGATGAERIALVRLPLMGRTIIAASLLTACLGASEIGASILTQPVRFWGGSLAVQVDMQMHYGRQDETTILAAIMMTPALLAAMIVPRLGRRRVGSP